MVSRCGPLIDSSTFPLTELRAVAERGGARASIDGAGSAVDHHDGGDIAETHKQFPSGISETPLATVHRRIRPGR